MLRVLIPIGKRNVITATLCAVGTLLHAQNSEKKTTPIELSAVTPAARGVLLKLNGRLRKPEKARIALSGVLQDGAGSRALQIEWQLPGQLRITEAGSTPRLLKFDGSTLRLSSGSVSARDEALIESLALDSVEQLLSDLATNAACRVLMTGLKLPGLLGPNAPEFAVLRISFDPNTKRAVDRTEPKTIFFDQSTDLIRSVRYQKSINGRSVAVETIVQRWNLASGEPFPELVRRIENDTEVFRFSITEASSGSRSPDTHFQ